MNKVVLGLFVLMILLAAIWQKADNKNREYINRATETSTDVTQPMAALPQHQMSMDLSERQTEMTPQASAAGLREQSPLPIESLSATAAPDLFEDPFGNTAFIPLDNNDNSHSSTVIISRWPPQLIESEYVEGCALSEHHFIAYAETAAIKIQNRKKSRIEYMQCQFNNEQGYFFVKLSDPAEQLVQGVQAFQFQ